jgi:putative membrane protein
MLFLIVLGVLLLAVVIFALQNAQAVTVWFLFWQLQSSVAVVALAATAAGVLIAELFGLARRLRRWKRGRPVTGPARPAVPPSESDHSSRRRD